MTPLQRIKAPTKEVIVHELGHLLVGLEIGLIESGIEFTENDPHEVARAHYSKRNSVPEQVAIRSLAGMYSQAVCLPSSLEDELNELLLKCHLFKDSSVLAIDSPVAGMMSRHGFIGDWKCLILQAKEFSDAESPQLDGLRTAHEKLVELFGARNIQAAITALLNDVADWLETDDEELDYGGWVFYPRARAEKALKKCQSVS
jgi:hypothetical protein